MQLIDGKATAAAIKEQIAQEVKEIIAKGGKQPHLVAVLVGHDGGSETYVKNKVLACEKCGFKSTLIRYEEDVTEEELLKCVDKLNRDEDVDGFIVQLPLPKHIARTWTVSTRSTWAEWRSECLASSRPHRSESSPSCSITTSRPAARNASSWVAPTSWASLWRS